MNRQNSEAAFYSPLTSVVEVHSAELFNCAQEMDDFFQKEWHLLYEHINHINENINFFCCVLKEYEIDKCERKQLLLNNTKEKVFGKIRHLKSQEQMIIYALKTEGNKLHNDIQHILRKYDIYSDC